MGFKKLAARDIGEFRAVGKGPASEYDSRLSELLKNFDPSLHRTVEALAQKGNMRMSFGDGEPLSGAKPVGAKPVGVSPQVWARFTKGKSSKEEMAKVMRKGGSR